mmetsp:Transcript_20625/g.48660  ORF Transcript_20625/g.48660 Transcript_20625/m.48660 type:complete len:244 (+) Transcript_20625:717-1448(+)
MQADRRHPDLPPPRRRIGVAALVRAELGEGVAASGSGGEKIVGAVGVYFPGGSARIVNERSLLSGEAFRNHVDAGGQHRIHDEEQTHRRAPGVGRDHHARTQRGYDPSRDHQEELRVDHRPDDPRFVELLQANFPGSEGEDGRHEKQQGVPTLQRVLPTALARHADRAPLDDGGARISIIGEEERLGGLQRRDRGPDDQEDQVDRDQTRERHQHRRVRDLDALSPLRDLHDPIDRGHFDEDRG